MKRVSSGSCILVVMSCAAVLSILVVVVMHRAQYALRAASDQVRHEQRLAACEAMVRYGVSWYATNTQLIASSQEHIDHNNHTNHKDHESHDTWVITFDDMPISNSLDNNLDKTGLYKAIITIVPTNKVTGMTTGMPNAEMAGASGTANSADIAVQLFDKRFDNNLDQSLIVGKLSCQVRMCSEIGRIEIVSWSA